jgi:ABC-type lipoprotein export system ATPase subunit
MKKIDFHVHTKCIKGYDAENGGRDIDADSFVKIMDEANIGYVAITNHNTFDLEQYNEIKEKTNILVFPGIEIDIVASESSGDYKNLNLIFAPKYAEELNEKTEGWAVEKHKVGSFGELINEFDGMNPIYYCDYKSSKRRVETEHIGHLRTLTTNPVIADFNNPESKIVLSFLGIDGLIGSDNINWGDYQKKSVKLGLVNWDITNFEEIWKLLKYKNNDDIVTELLSRKNKKHFAIDIQKDKVGIDIIDGLNIIFGNKGTGKSQIISSIKQQLDEKGIKNCYYKASEKNEKFSKIFPTEFEITSSYHSKFDFVDKNISILRSLLDSNKSDIASYKNFKEAFKNDKVNKFKILNNKIENVLIANNGANFKALYDKLKASSGFYKGNIDEFDFIKKEMVEIIKNIEIIKDKIGIEYINLNKEYLLKEHIGKMIEHINQEMFINKGFLTTPKKIGLFDIWKFRKDIKDACIAILNYKKVEEEIVRENVELSMKDKGELIYRQILKPYDMNDKQFKKIKGDCTPTNINKFINILEKITNSTNVVKKDDIKELNDFLSDITVNAKDFVSCNGAIYNSLESGEKQTIDLSDGEQSALLIVEQLKTNSEYILLDEPSIYLGGELIERMLIPKINELKKSGKTIIIATHNSNLAINSLPINMIYRKFLPESKQYMTAQGNWWIKKFFEDDDFVKIVTDNFEGSLDSFNIRKGIYLDEIKSN